MTQKEQNQLNQKMISFQVIFKSKINLKDETTKKKRNCFQRTFGKLGKGSLRAANFVIIQAAIGAGVLALPYMFRSNGMYVGIAFLIFGGIISYTSMRILMWASFKTDIKDYTKLVEYCYGQNVKFFLNVIFVLFMLGVCITYNVLSKLTNFVDHFHSIPIYPLSDEGDAYKS